MTKAEILTITIKYHLHIKYLYIQKINSEIKLAAKKGLYEIITDFIPIDKKYILGYYRALGYDIILKCSNEEKDSYSYLISWNLHY